MKKLQLKNIFLSVALATTAMAPAMAADAPAVATTQAASNKDMMKVLSFVKNNKPIPVEVTKILEDYKNGKIKPDLQNYDAEAIAALKQPPLALLPDAYKTQIAAAYKSAAANENLAGVKLNGKAMNTLYTALQLLRQQYVLPLGPERLEEKAIEGLAFKRLENAYEGKPAVTLSDMDLIEAALSVAAAQDPHSDYMPPKQASDMSVKMAGHFAGLGLNVRMEGGEVKDGVPAGGKISVSPREESPASAAGMKEGDLVIAIQQGKKGENGEKKSVVKTASEPGLNLEEAVKLMKGDADTFVTLTIERGTETFETEIQRATIEINPVTARIIDVPSEVAGEPAKKVGYVALKEFTGIAAQKVEQAIEKLQNNPNGAPDSWVLDLSNNPGGRVDQVLYIADLFLTKGLILAEKGRNEQISRFNAEVAYEGDILKGQKLKVIINSRSASASEILSGALKDNGRAEVVGNTSFGKGSVQQIVPLPNGGGLHETIQLYYTPSGSIQERGVTPNTEVAMPWMKDANKYGERNMKGAIPYPGKLAGVTDVVTAPTDKTCTALKRAFTEQEAAGIDKGMFEFDPDNGKLVKFSADEKSPFGYKRDDKDGKILLLKEALACAVEGTYGIEKLTRTTPLPAPIKQLTPGR